MRGKKFAACAIPTLKRSNLLQRFSISVSFLSNFHPLLFGRIFARQAEVRWDACLRTFGESVVELFFAVWMGNCRRGCQPSVLDTYRMVYPVRGICPVEGHKIKT